MSENINVNEIKPGKTFLRNGDVYLVLESSHSKSGRGQAHVKVKAKNLMNFSTINITFVGGERVEKAYVEKKNMSFLYKEGTIFNFMESTTFEQIGLEEERLKDEKPFLIEGLEVQISFFNNVFLFIELPKNITMKVTQTSESAVKGDTVSGATKKAILETGLEIEVPLFVNNDDLIVVNSVTKKYISRG